MVVGAVIERLRAARAQRLGQVRGAHVRHGLVDRVDQRLLVLHRRAGGQLLAEHAPGVRHDRGRQPDVRMLRGEGADGGLRLPQLRGIFLRGRFQQISVRAEIHAVHLPDAERPLERQIRGDPQIPAGKLVGVPALESLGKAAVGQRGERGRRLLREHAVLAVGERPVLPQQQPACGKEADRRERREDADPLRRPALQDPAAAGHLLLLGCQFFL